jgi:hypothetical protein
MRRPLVYLAAFLFPLSATATPFIFDFTTLGSNNTLLGTTVTVNGVLAEGLLLDGSPEPLWLRNETNDHGLGVCSEGQSACSTGGGDVNELTNESGVLTTSEGIRLTLPTNSNWSQLWVSSLDNGGNESGILLWSANPNSFALANSFIFNFNDFGGPVEGEILGLPQASAFDTTAPYLLFINNFNNGTNNDYLVWKGVYNSPPLEQAPEPGSVALLGAALSGLILLRRRSAV